MILLCFLALLCGTWTSKNKHLYFPLHDALLKLNILYFLILLHILPARIVLYIPILLHILPVPIVLYFFLDNFIIFLAFHVKVALPKINIYTFCHHRVYFRESLVILHSFCKWFYYFCNPLRGLCTSQIWTYVLHVHTMCTSQTCYLCISWSYYYVRS
jgi:hypothetical protein